MSSYKKYWQHFDINKNGRDFCVGDIHGYFTRLQKLLDKVEFDPEKDRLFSVGDNIDRGPESNKVLEWLDLPWFFSISGNHEVIATEYHKDPTTWKNYDVHGGKWFIELSSEERERYVNEFKKLPLVFEIETINGTVGVVHGECTPDDWWEFKFKFDDYKDNALWGYTKWYYHMKNKANIVKNIWLLVHGHNNVEAPTMNGNTIYIDTGKMLGSHTLLEISNPDGLVAHTL